MSHGPQNTCEHEEKQEFEEVGWVHECHYFNFILLWVTAHSQTGDLASYVSCSGFMVHNLHQVKDGGIENSPQLESACPGSLSQSPLFIYPNPYFLKTVNPREIPVCAGLGDVWEDANQS